MKINELTRLIKKTVKEAVREELKDILVEAVSIASEPDIDLIKESPSIDEAKIPQTNFQFSPPTSLEEALQQTRSSMSSQEFKNIVGESFSPGQESFKMTSYDVGPSLNTNVGLDVSNLDFVKKAAAVYNKSLEKDKQKAF